MVEAIDNDKLQSNAVSTAMVFSSNIHHSVSAQSLIEQSLIQAGENAM